MSWVSFPLPDALSVCKGKFKPLRDLLAGTSVSDIADAQWEDIREMVPPPLRSLFASLHRHLSNGSLKSTNLVGKVLNLSRQVTPGFFPDPSARLHMTTLRSKMEELNEEESLELQLIHVGYNGGRGHDQPLSCYFGGKFQVLRGRTDRHFAQQPVDSRGMVAHQHTFALGLHCVR